MNVLVFGALAVSLSVAMISMVGNLLWSRRVLAVMGFAGYVLALAVFGYTFDPVRGVIGSRGSTVVNTGFTKAPGYFRGEANERIKRLLFWESIHKAAKGGANE